MPRYDKSSYTEHIEAGYNHSGFSHQEAERRAWATVNKEIGEGKKSGSGRENPKPCAIAQGRPYRRGQPEL